MNGHRRRPARRVRWVLALLALSAPAVSAFEIFTPNDRPIAIRGYYKNFFLVLADAPKIAGTSIADEGASDVNRARLMFDAELSDNWELALHYETIAEIEPRLAGGGFFESRDRPGLTPLAWSIERSGNLTWTHEIDRLYARGRTKWGDLTIGRQAIGWGVGLNWAPLDLLIGFSPVQLDREYRLGVDAVRFLVPLGSFTEGEIVYAAYGTRFDDHATALRLRTTFPEAGIDVGFIAGKYFEDAVAGALIVGEIAGVGLHSSLNLTHHFGSDSGPRDFARFVAGADYRFSGNVFAVLEYYFNGWGASRPSRYINRFTSDRLRRGELFNLGRHYLGFVVDWEAHPLVHLGARGQSNLADPSAQIGPLLTLSVSDEATLECGAFFALGEGGAALRSEIGEMPTGVVLRSELGNSPHLFFAAAKVYF